MKSAYAKTGKALFLTLLPLVAVYFFVVQSKRARVIVQNKNGEVLLVKSWFGRQNWNLPGGGVRPGENPETAALRELQEETGIVDVSLQFLGEQPVKGETGTYKAYIYKAQTSQNGVPSQSGLNKAEIVDAKWFAADKLPERVAKITAPHL